MFDAVEFVMGAVIAAVVSGLITSAGWSGCTGSLREEIDARDRQKTMACDQARKRTAAVITAITNPATSDEGRLIAVELSSWMPYCAGDHGARMQRTILARPSDTGVVHGVLLMFGNESPPIESP